MEKCDNCERIIGNLETPMVWSGVVVCADCYAKLSSASGFRQLPVDSPWNRFSSQAGAGLLSLIAVVLFLCWLSKPGSSSPPASPPTPAPSPITVKDSDIVADFHANEVSAEAKWKGQLVDVTGTIREIRTDILDHPTAVLHDGDGEGDVDCNFQNSPENRSLLALWEKGYMVDVTGVCTGMVMGDVQIEAKYK